MLKQPLIYVTVSNGRLTAQVIGDTKSVTLMSNGLSHPRSLMGDYNVVESCMKDALNQLGSKGWFRRSPIVLTHLLPKVEGGYTNVELRAFREAALGAGAAQSYLLADYPQLKTNDIEAIKKHFQ